MHILSQHLLSRIKTPLVVPRVFFKVAFLGFRVKTSFCHPGRNMIVLRCKWDSGVIYTHKIGLGIIINLEPLWSRKEIDRTTVKRGNFISRRFFSPLVILDLCAINRGMFMKLSVCPGTFPRKALITLSPPPPPCWKFETKTKGWEISKQEESIFVPSNLCILPTHSRGFGKTLRRCWWERAKENGWRGRNSNSDIDRKLKEWKIMKFLPLLPKKAVRRSFRPPPKEPTSKKVIFLGPNRLIGFEKMVQSQIKWLNSLLSNHHLMNIWTPERRCCN